MGKSTVAVNLALAFARLGLRSGILDTDIFGPSVPRMVGLEGQQEPRVGNGRSAPLCFYGVHLIGRGGGEKWDMRGGGTCMKGRYNNFRQDDDEADRCYGNHR